MRTPILWLALSVVAAILAGCSTGSGARHATAASQPAAACAHCAPTNATPPTELTRGTAGSAEPSSATTTPWLAPEQRRLRFPAAVRFEDQAGNPTRAADLEGRPLAVSFLFTRCDNPLKCPLIAKRMAALQQALPAAGLEGKVNLALITYDPEYDTPRQLATWGAAQGLTFDACTRMLRPNPQQKTGLFDALNIDVNYGAGGVNIHRIQLLLFDRRGRFARSHHTVIWDQPRVLADLQRLASE